MSTAPPKTVKLTVITDFICACCYIGHYELHEAIAYCKDTLGLPIQFEFEHIPFRLINKSILPDNVSLSKKEEKEEFMQKFLGKDQFTALQTNVVKWAEEKGRPVTFNGAMTSTHKAHRIVVKAGQLGGQRVQTPLAMAIFTASMEEGKDLSDSNVLADLAVQAGAMSREDALAFLESDELSKEVEDMSDAARAKGITGVPVIIIDGKWAVSGGQSSDVYIQIFKKIATCRGPSCATTSPLPPNLVQTCA